jgi:Ribonuclease G/E
MRVVVDAAIGETRSALVRDDRVVTLKILRASDAGRRARWGEVYDGRITRVERGLRGAFVDLGLSDEEGFLPLHADGSAAGDRAAGAAREGQSATFSVVREGARGKGPVLELLVGPCDGKGPRRLSRHPSDETERDNPSPQNVRDLIDEAIEAALSPSASISGGGSLTIEPTAALTAIDVDAGGRKGADPERLALELNLAAAAEAMSQLRLRNLGGVAAIDFVAMRSAKARAAIIDAIRAAGKMDPWGPIIAPMSRFGIVEISRAQLVRPLHEQLLGRNLVETLSLKVLRAIERETASARGRIVEARIAPAVHDWLERESALWRMALCRRIGDRWRLAPAPHFALERIDVQPV